VALIALIPWLTDRAEKAAATQAALALTPSSTTAPTLTLIPQVTAPPTLSSLEQLQTAQMQLTQSAATQVAANLKATQDNVLSKNATGTAQQIDATEAAARATLLALSWTPSNTPTPTPTNTATPTPTLTATWTPTNIPTLTMTSTPTPDPLQAALDTARAFTGSNADWQTLYPDGFQHRFDDGVPMVLVPVGSFTIGANPKYDSEKNGNLIRFDAPFWIDLTEVTQADFTRLGGKAASASRFVGDQRPVEQITWFEARDFCAKRGARLPTEAEWEYAARGPSQWEYPWGDTWDANNAVWNRSGSQGTANVGSIPAGRSWVGALDMSGNVWEWVSSLYLPYNSQENREADTGNRTDVRRVLRGGSWYDYSDVLHAGNRYGVNPDFRNNNFGFRCARSS
jgi:formylglycine-generating enzyme required for sulfatase activity